MVSVEELAAEKRCTPADILHFAGLPPGTDKSTLVLRQAVLDAIEVDKAKTKDEPPSKPPVYDWAAGEEQFEDKRDANWRPKIEKSADPVLDSLNANIALTETWID